MAQSDGNAETLLSSTASGVSPEARQTLQQIIAKWRAEANERPFFREYEGGARDGRLRCADALESWLTALPPASPDIFKGHTAVEVLAWDRGWREASRQARESAPLLPAPPETAEDYCETCGERLSRHYTPCPLSPVPEQVLGLLERLTAEGKRPAALRILARHLRPVTPEASRFVQSSAPLPPAAPPEPEK